MTLMHCYHVGGFSRGNSDAKAIAKKIKAEVDGKVAEIQASINKKSQSCGVRYGVLS